MTKRRMFLRMITASLLRRRSRMLIALLSIGIGATILAGLVTIYVDVPRQMGAQFRSYGANMLLLPKDGEALNSESLEDALKAIPKDALVGAAPYRYVRLDMTTRQQSFTAAGTDFAEITKTSPYFSVEGAYPSKTRQVLAGKEIADTIGVKVGSHGTDLPADEQCSQQNPGGKPRARRKPVRQGGGLRRRDRICQRGAG